MCPLEGRLISCEGSEPSGRAGGNGKRCLGNSLAHPLMIKTSRHMTQQVHSQTETQVNAAGRKRPHFMLPYLGTRLLGNLFNLVLDVF